MYRDTLDEASTSSPHGSNLHPCIQAQVMRMQQNMKLATATKRIGSHAHTKSSGARRRCCGSGGGGGGNGGVRGGGKMGGRGGGAGERTGGGG